jgi:hypothetical protein
MRVARATSSAKCDAEVKAASDLYAKCAAAANPCDEWQVSRLITRTAAITRCAEAHAPPELSEARFCY